MIAELYDIDNQLVDNFISNDITFEIQSLSSTTPASWVTDFTLTNDQILSESLEITQSICDDEELQVGGCIPSQLKLNVMNISDDLSGKRIVVKIRETFFSDVLYPGTEVLPGSNLYPYMQPIQTNEYILFIGQIYSYKKKQNKKIREIIAFDRMYFGSTVLCKNKLYNYFYNYWNNPNTHATVRKFGASLGKFCDWAQINRPGSAHFVNYNKPFEMVDNYIKDVLNKNFTALEGLKWSCELNGVFLIDDSPSSNDLTSITANVRVVKLYENVSTKFDISSYSSLDYDDFETKPIRLIQFYATPDSSRWYRIYSISNAGYSHYISDNPLTRTIGSGNDIKPIIKNLCSSTDDGEVYAEDGIDRIFNNVYVYRPFKASIFNRWWVQVGDRVRIPTTDEDVPYVESIVFSRKIKGINGMTVEIEAKGIEIFGKEYDEVINE